MMIPTQTTSSVSWSVAFTALCRVVPGAEVVGERISTKWLERLIYERDPDSTWTRIGAHGGDDLDVFKEIYTQLEDLDAESFAVIIADKSYYDGYSPFGMAFEHVREFVDSFHERYEDELFSGDVLILFEDRCVFVHHEGLYAVLYGDQSAGLPISDRESS